MVCKNSGSLRRRSKLSLFRGSFMRLCPMGSGSSDAQRGLVPWTGGSPPSSLAGICKCEKAPRCPAGLGVTSKRPRRRQLPEKRPCTRFEILADCITFQLRFSPALSKEQPNLKRSGSLCHDRSLSPAPGLWYAGVRAGAGLGWVPATGGLGRGGARLAGAQRCPKAPEFIFGF